MNDWVIVDTDILIDAGRGVFEAVDCLQQIEQRWSLAISMVTQMELIVGCRNKKEINATERFLKRYQIIKLSESISDQAVGLLRSYRLSHGLLIADALIAATALSCEQPLITKNKKDYQYITGLNLLAYPAPFSSAPDSNL